MASRVVWLIANAIVEPRQVLGLTFTRKAAHELSARIAARLTALAAAMRAEGLTLPPGLERGHDELVGQRPLVHTYNGFALDLVREHALAVGIDPELTMMSTSASWQLAHSIVEGWDDSLDLEASPATLTAALLSLTSSIADHLVTPEQLGAAPPGDPRPPRRDPAPGRRAPAHHPQGRRLRAHVARVPPRPDPAARALRPGPDGQLRPGFRRPGLPRGPGGARGARRGRTRPTYASRGPARRVPGHVRRPAADAHGPVRSRPCRLRGGGPPAGDLRVARRLGGLPRGLRDDLRHPGAARAAAHPVHLLAQ